MIREIGGKIREIGEKTRGTEGAILETGTREIGEMVQTREGETQGTVGMTLGTEEVIPEIVILGTTVCPLTMFSPTYAVYSILDKISDNEQQCVQLFDLVIDNYLAAIQVLEAFFFD
eukprot:sb/3476483/